MQIKKSYWVRHKETQELKRIGEERKEHEQRVVYNQQAYQCYCMLSLVGDVVMCLGALLGILLAFAVAGTGAEISTYLCLASALFFFIQIFIFIVVLVPLNKQFITSALTEDKQALEDRERRLDLFTTLLRCVACTGVVCLLAAFIFSWG